MKIIIVDETVKMREVDVIPTHILSNEGLIEALIITKEKEREILTRMKCIQCIEDGEQCIGCMIIEYQGKKHFAEKVRDTNKEKD